LALWNTSNRRDSLWRQLAPTDNLVTVGSFKQDSDLDGAAGEGAEGGADEYSVCCCRPQGYDPQVYILEANRVLLGLPFVSKATGVPLLAS